jgi:hypothetical protein
MTRMELVKCGNPKCWRFVSRAVGSPRDTCDDACAIQRAALKPQRAAQEQQSTDSPRYRRTA